MSAEPLPSRIGKYRIVTRLASGGMGTVYLAKASGEMGFERTVVLKVLHPHLAADARLVQRFLDEARIASQIVHPNVVTVLDVTKAGDAVFLVLEYVHGSALTDLMRDARALGERVPVGVAVAIVRDALDALHAAHEMQDAEGRPLEVVHRDVSPHNVIVSNKGVAYLTDFGVAKLRGAVPVTETGQIVGKPGYLAPEQLIGGKVTASTDLYAAGVVLWELLTGVRLFTGLREQTAALGRNEAPPLASSKRSDLPPGLTDLLRRLLSRAPADRPPTALAASRELEQVAKPAHRSEVAEWVKRLAAPRLARLDGVLRLVAADDGAVSDEATSSDPFAATVRQDAPADFTPFDAALEAPTRRDETKRSPRPLVSVFVGIAIGGGIVAGGVAALFAGRGPPGPPAAAAPAPTAEAPSRAPSDAGDAGDAAR